METQELGLTNLPGTEKKIAALLGLKKIALSDLDDLDINERRHFGMLCSKMLQNLKGEERDDFLNKIEAITPADNKQQVWEYNHQVITDAIAKLTEHYGCMPTKNNIAEATGLSRQTITKHLKEYKNHPAYAEQTEQFKIMVPKLMAKVYRAAVKGDIRAARLYFETVGAINKRQGKTVVNSQNNYIQINNTILSQENLKRLNAEQLKLIESVVTMVLPVGEVSG